MQPKHMNPDLERWELHRVWVVEATLKEGKRHIYAKRVLYIDEDSWIIVATDQYDARGQLFVSQFMPTPWDMTSWHRRLRCSTTTTSSRAITASRACAACTSRLFYNDGLPEREWSPDSLAGAGVR